MIIFAGVVDMIEEILLNNIPIYIMILAVVIYNHKILKKNHEILEEIKKFIR